MNMESNKTGSLVLEGNPDTVNETSSIELQTLSIGVHLDEPSAIMSRPSSNEPDSDQLEDQSQRLSFPRLIAAYLCLCLCYFISYLDMNSLTTSLPTISVALNAGPSITWAGIAYLLGQTSCQPLYGRISDVIGRKPILLFSVGCVSVGGLLNGFAQTALWLYLSRAISGVGGGGISSLVSIIVSDLVSLKSRGKYQGAISLAVGTGAASGPFVAAGLIRRGPDAWRWTFWIPTIAAAICFFLLLFTLPLKPVSGNWKEKTRKVDWFGVVTSMAGVVLMVMPINSGGSIWPWGSPRTISTLTVGVTLLVVFVTIEAFFAKLPIIPLRLFKHKSTCLLFIVGILHDFVWQATQYFLPLYFQTIRGYTPLKSATLILPFLVTQGVAGAASGPVMSRLARYSPVLRIGFAMWTLGTGLHLLFDRNTPTAVYVVVLIIEGSGIGWVHQPGLVALQANARHEDRAVATGTRNVLRSLGSVVGVAVSTAAHYEATNKALQRTVPDPLRTRVLTGMWHPGESGTKEFESDILDARMQGFQLVFIILVPVMGLCLLGSFFVDDVVLTGDVTKMSRERPEETVAEPVVVGTGVEIGVETGDGLTPENKPVSS